MRSASFLDQVTPVILTYNEEPNIGRCLERLKWAKSIVVVDSGSTDATEAICRRDARVHWFVRAFDNHAAQWTFATKDTGIDSEWVLALDADYMVTPEAEAELSQLQPADTVDGYRVTFRYAVGGRVLRSGIYPPVMVLFRRTRTIYVQDGHTQRAVVPGPVHQLAAHFVHDDRKSLERWVSSQLRYARLEVAETGATSRGLKGWIRRRTPLAPVLVGLYCLIWRGALFEGRPGWTYAMERMLAEAMIGAAAFSADSERRAGDSAEAKPSRSTHIKG